MAAFLESQLDFIFFFYGLAFILLGAVCLSIAKEPRGRAVGLVLFGGFGLIHGFSEWLDLAALIVGDSPLFANIRVGCMTVSYMFLLEFARVGAVRLGYRLPGGWIHLPLLCIVVIGGIVGDLATANALARYAFGLLGAIGSALVMLERAQQRATLVGPLTKIAAVMLIVYGVAAGFIVPEVPFWPANIINQTSFMKLTGMPIQLVRGLIACTLAVLIWGIWGQLLIKSVDSARYTEYLRRQFIGTLVALAAIFVGGWMLTDFLGGIYRDDVQEEARGDNDLLASRLAGETSAVRAMAKALAGVPAVSAMLSGAGPKESADAQQALELDVEASGAVLGQILDRSGQAVASSEPREFALLGTPNQSAAPWFEQAMNGTSGHQFEFDSVSGQRIYYASQPVRSSDGAIVGAVVLKKSLDALDLNLQGFDRAFFFVNADGVVLLTNRNDEFKRPLWPTAARPKLALTEQFGAPARPTMLEREVKTSAWTKFDGRRGFVLRTPVEHSEWSMVIVIPVSGMFASRFLGIIITLQFAITTLFYFFGREHGVRDNIEMVRRLELQQRADNLQVQATTDPLTGVYNRLKFDEELLKEIERARRYATPLTLTLYDVDHFKEVNDAYGHQAGDRVLIELSAIVSHGIRQSDLLARWGGEEFVVLLPGTDALQAGVVAEKLRGMIAGRSFDEIGTITCCFGVATYAAGDTAATLVARADNALYRAKMNGRNRVELDTPMVDGADLAPLGS
ncbi:MAG: diguanylate cyclase [Rhodopseudomonas sp.]|uniref:sensor domain-containing diguanylate cyclase n=1 Tax=Rhodopseudomonas sp. TaxID=1078 RepID=UPI0017E69665|nr:sensor domain-containing diguanylate cyclase [Rhodopseudomonas sp.]NVN87734.1 diguanylate cyclase [Rhodopseudomonas sp.]